jgi:hypothetical protein
VPPGGGRILFGVEGGASNKVVYIDAAGPYVIPTVADKTLSHATWAGASSVIFDSERNGPQHLYRMGIDGGHVVELTFGTANQLRASVSLDGATLADETFTAANGGQDLGLHVANIDGSHVRVITKGTRAGEIGGDSYAAISPDGQWVAFTHATGTGQPGVWLVRIDGSGLRRLTDDSFDAGVPRWSPDGTRILFSGNYDATSFVSGPLWVVAVPGGGSATSPRRSATTSCAACSSARVARGCAAKLTASVAPNDATTAARRLAVGPDGRRPSSSKAKSSLPLQRPLCRARSSMRPGRSFVDDSRHRRP